MRKFTLVSIVLFIAFILVGCSNSELERNSYLSKDKIDSTIIEEDGYTDLEDGYTDLEDGIYAITTGLSDISTKSGGDSYMFSEGTMYGDNGIQSGQLSGSESNDILEYDFYLSLFEVSQDLTKGVFLDYYNNVGYFDTLNMVKVVLNNNELAINGAVVELLNDSQEVIYRSYSNANGFAYLFPKTDQLDSVSEIRVSYDGQIIYLNYEYDETNNIVTINIDNSTETHQDIIEIMFVIDTTGSMGDEITFLKAEIEYVISQVSLENPNTVIKLALLLYRDLSDDYVTKYFDFTTDLNALKDILVEQSYGGGGDFEEAVDIALFEAVNKNWSDDNTTKLLFHVLDAPPHNNQEDMTRYYDAIYQASELGIHMIPVASSGIDKYTEYLLRNEALMTGGTYLYLTNDSGIGGDHIEASTLETEVEYLNRLLVRVINEFHTGVREVKIPFVPVQKIGIE